jgi:hypothetical protein
VGHIALQHDAVKSAVFQLCCGLLGPDGRHGLRRISFFVQMGQSCRDFVTLFPIGGGPWEAFRELRMSDTLIGDVGEDVASSEFGTGPIEEFGPAPRRKSIPVRIGNVTVGGMAPIVVQSMTNTDTADIDGTVKQVLALARSGSELVRITVDRDEAAAAVPVIRERLDILGCDVPLVGDFHYIGHKLLNDHPACAEALAKYRINPGNVGFKAKRDAQFGAIIERAIEHGKPVRIGVNWGSLDQELLTRLMDENAKSSAPKSARAVMHEAIVQSALLSAEYAEGLGLGRTGS